MQQNISVARAELRTVMVFTIFISLNLYSSKRKGPTEGKITFARVTWPRGFFLPMSAFPPIFQRFKYRSAVEQASSAQYRLSVCSQTAGQLDAHQPARLTHEGKAAAQVNFTYYSSQRGKVCLPQSWLLVVFLNLTHIFNWLSRGNVNVIWLYLRIVPREYCLEEAEEGGGQWGKKATWWLTGWRWRKTSLRLVFSLCYFIKCS